MRELEKLLDKYNWSEYIQLDTDTGVRKTLEQRILFPVDLDVAHYELSAMQARIERLEKRAKWPLANWSCRVCGYVNHGESTVCNFANCGTERE